MQRHRYPVYFLRSQRELSRFYTNTSPTMVGRTVA
nr:MAG TPA: hypothetical protein [Caudoviricetes sp.]